MPKFSLYARLRAADEEAGKDRLRARLVWCLGLQHFFLWGSENSNRPDPVSTCALAS